MKIINKNEIICDKLKYDIKDYFQKIKNTPNEFLDDIMIYNHCEKCKNDSNKYFCFNCMKNICNKCYEKCKNENHDFKNLDKMTEQIKSYLITIKNFLSTYVIPMKESDEKTIEEEKNEDIFLIIEIISKDYINYFHFINIIRIIYYISSFYLNKFSNENYEGFGKNIDEDGCYYIGQFKDNQANGKGI